MNSPSTQPASPSASAALRISGNPLCDVGTARSLLGLTEDQVLGLIRKGAIRYAFDLRQARAQCRLVRMTIRSLRDYLQKDAPAPDDQAALDNVINSILPHQRGILEARELTRVFTCGCQHITNLVNEGTLVAVRGPLRGPGGSARITRASVVRFLNSRRMK